MTIIFALLNTNTILYEKTNPRFINCREHSNNG